MSKNLERLSRLKLKQPKGIRDFIFQNTNFQTTPYSRYGCVEQMEKWNDTWILRVFAYNLNLESRTYRNIEIKEVQRKILGEKKYLISGAVTSNMSGRRVDFDEDSKFYEVSSNWEFYGYQMYDYQDVIDDLNIPYCSWEIYKSKSYNNNLRFIDYLTIYISEPRIERLVKLGLGNYLTSVRYLDLSKRKIYDVFKLERKWEQNIETLKIRDILNIRREKNIENLADLKLYDDIFNSRWPSYTNIKKLTSFKRMKVYYKKVMNGASDLYLYEDYLRFAKQLGYQLKSNKVLYPNNLKEAHDIAMDENNRILDQKLEDEQRKNILKFEEQYKENEKYSYENKHLMIVPVKTPKELIEESKALNHCVRTYADAVANGNKKILFVRNVDYPLTPLVTVEVQAGKVTQARGKNNSSPTENIKEFLSEWSIKNKINYI